MLLEKERIESERLESVVVLASAVGKVKKVLQQVNLGVRRKWNERKKKRRKRKGSLGEGKTN
jgi:hypothetical protein